MPIENVGAVPPSGDKREPPFLKFKSGELSFIEN
jgi:hypothetical protein